MVTVWVACNGKLFRDFKPFFRDPVVPGFGGLWVTGNRNPVKPAAILEQRADHIARLRLVGLFIDANFVQVERLWRFQLVGIPQVNPASTQIFQNLIQVNVRTSWGNYPMALMKILSLNSNYMMTAISVSQVGEPTDARFKSQLNPRHHILVVDDDGDIRRLNSEVLACSGYKVDVAADGALGWDALQLNNYDLLVTDQDMPNLTGVGLLKKLRAARMVLPVILISGTIPTKELSQHPWLQIDATLLKPYTPDELLASVEKVLYATDGGAGRTTPPPDWREHPVNYRSQL
jgi:CheY-like chemotaxis protein